MRIARWAVGGTVSEGFVVGENVIPFPERRTVADVLASGLEAAHGLHDAVAGGLRPDDAHVALAAVRLLAPLVPATIRDFVAFEEHVEGVSAAVDGKSEVVPEWYQAPTFYFTNPHTVIGTEDELSPPACERLDFELELAAVIGAGPSSTGANLRSNEADAHIFGYTIMNDWSARDIQSREMKVRLGPAKGKDFGTTLGPWIVTADELAPYVDPEGFLAVRAEVYVNGTLVGEDLVSNMGWTFAELVAYASRNSRVVPGDVLGSGTVGNGGCLAELWGRRGILEPRPLQRGDVVRMVVEGIGEIVNTVGEAVAASPVRAARKTSRARMR
ncbi:fumarylacetoacetate hydrolase family protein [Microbacterium sp. SSM24]|uniref:fumarylacetoacetate hydrolase family protein n=1 Tax=Microbacterium sp. SSM24 TaxID=2991714 RepID=UPI0022266358|nr:fumarylacetoacetate hydrolase family protein [Microbacterium sp. SSM24]MCW3492591.1 fumarylacetoacetate hydrolase family protein [Microbacterium sp. SSM24]